MNDDLSARLRATFLQELQEQVREMNASLLQLEQRPADAEPVRTLFRSAHTIKGAARVAGAADIEEACHALESVFADVRDRERRLEGPDFSLLFAVVDALEDAGRNLRAAAADDAQPAARSAALDALLPRLRALTGSAAPRPLPQDTTPAATAGPARATPAADDRPARRPASRQQADAAPDAAPRQQLHDSADELVRVSAERLDTLIASVGELLIAAGRVVRAHGPDDTEARRLAQAVGEVADIARRLRLRPFAEACEALPRAVRDIAAGEGKEVDLELIGADVEADRMVIDALRDPLLHLVRNAVDHGIETPAEREQRGKDRRGRVRVAAEMTGARLVVTVADDGAGVDEAAVRDAMRRRGRPLPRDRAALEDAVLGGGFSTRAEASEISGRGVGVDLVRSAVERIGGSVDVTWQQGAGTTFTLVCPPTPSTTRAVLVRLGAHLFALPTASVLRLRRLGPGQLRNVEGRPMLPTGRGPIPVNSLAALLGPPLEARTFDGPVPCVIVAAGARRAALVVDEVVAEEEIVVRPLPLGRHAVPWSSGVAVLPNGRIALVLAAAALLARAARAGTGIAPAFAGERAETPPRVLVADDSITTRMLERSVLEAAGFVVSTAVDGEDAWRQLQQDGADVLVADVEMPRMDGFALCRRIRASDRFADLPVVLVTGLSSEADRARGLDAGADAYIVKSGFNNESLLDTVRQLAGRT